MSTLPNIIEYRGIPWPSSLTAWLCQIVINTGTTSSSSLLLYHQCTAAFRNPVDLLHCCRPFFFDYVGFCLARYRPCCSCHSTALLLLQRATTRVDEGERGESWVGLKKFDNERNMEPRTQQATAVDFVLTSGR